MILKKDTHHILLSSKMDIFVKKESLYCKATERIMKRSTIKKVLISCLLALSTTLAQAQSLSASEVSKKWGKVTKEELAMTVYPKDTSAKAVVLYQQRYGTYTYNSRTGFRVTNFIANKIKILKEEGKSEGNIVIPYYYRTNGDRESVSGIEAWSYNLVDGKTVKTKLDKDYIFDEEINDKYHRIKFSMPEVKVGTVIEYKYNTGVDRVSTLPDWDLQSDIPALNTDFQISIPEYFDFNIAVKGLELLNIKDGAENTIFNLGNDNNGSPIMLSCTMRQISCLSQDIPSLKDEDYVWCMDDYLSGVRFELRGSRFPNEMYKPFTQTWESLEKALLYESDLSIFLKLNNPWKEETAKLVEKITDDGEKINALYDFVKKQVRWNNSYELIGDNPKNAMKNGTGSNVQINYLLMSVLRDAGFQTYPILLSLRTNGRLPLTHPSINKLSTFIVAAQTKDSLTFYMDGSSKYGGANVLPTNLLSDRARIFDDRSIEKWVNLSKLTANFQISTIQASLDHEGKLSGVRNAIYTNQIAYDYKSKFAESKDSMDFIKQMQNNYDVLVDSLDIAGKEPKSASVNERVVFNKQMDVAGDYIYINPMIFKHLTVNNFTQTERKLPVEFAYPYGTQTVCYLTIPDNYQVEELPKSVKYVVTGNKAVCQFMAQQTGNVVEIKYVFQIKQHLFTESEYSVLREFYGQAVAKNLEMMVLKKKQL